MALFSRKEVPRQMRKRKAPLQTQKGTMTHP
jgi:hypothetical protein